MFKEQHCVSNQCIDQQSKRDSSREGIVDAAKHTRDARQDSSGNGSSVERQGIPKHSVIARTQEGWNVEIEETNRHPQSSTDQRNRWSTVEVMLQSRVKD